MAGMVGLQRSSVSFRRHGSSGMIWDDTRLISGELILKYSSCTLDDHDHHREVIMLNDASNDHQVQKYCWSTTSAGGGGGGAVDFHAAAGKVAAANDPPSPRVSACGFFCTAFRKPNKSTTTPSSSQSRHST